MTTTTKTDELVTTSINERPLQARTNHSLELARLNREYTQMYDKWEGLMKDADYKDREAATMRREAAELEPKIAALSQKIKEAVGGGIVSK